MYQVRLFEVLMNDNIAIFIHMCIYIRHKSNVVKLTFDITNMKLNYNMVQKCYLFDNHKF